MINENSFGKKKKTLYRTSLILKTLIYSTLVLHSRHLWYKPECLHYRFPETVSQTATSPCLFRVPDTIANTLQIPDLCRFLPPTTLWTPKYLQLSIYHLLWDFWCARNQEDPCATQIGCEKISISRYSSMN